MEFMIATLALLMMFGFGFGVGVIIGRTKNEVNTRLIDADKLQDKLLEMGCMDDRPCYVAEIINRMITAEEKDNNDNGLCCSVKWFNAPHQKCR